MDDSASTPDPVARIVGGDSSHGPTVRPVNWLRTIAGSYAEQGLTWGTGDLLAVGDGDLTARAGALLSLLRGLTREGRPAFSDIVLVVPPGNGSQFGAGSASAESADRALPASLRSAFADGWRALGGPVLGERELEGALRVVRVVTPASLALGALLATLRDIMTFVSAESAIVIGEAVLYRAEDVRSSNGEISHPADLWGPHVHALLQRVIGAITEASLCVVVDLGAEYPPPGPTRELIESVRGIAIYSSDPAPPPVSKADLSRWDNLVDSGELGTALSEVEALADIPSWYGALLRSRLFVRAGGGEEARALLRGLSPVDAELSSEDALRLAIGAEYADADELAAEGLERAIPGLRDRDRLEVACALARRMGKQGLVEQIVGRLRVLYPGSATQRQYEAESLLRSGRYRDVAALLREVGETEAEEEASFWDVVADHLRDDGILDVHALAAAAAANPAWAARARQLGADHLESAGRYSEALALLMRSDADAPTSEGPSGLPSASADAAAVKDVPQADASPDEESSLAVLRLVERARLRGDTTVDEEVVAAVLEWVIRGCGHRPGDVRARVRLERLIGPQLLGVQGVATLANYILRLAAQPSRIEPAPRLRRQTEGLSADAIRGVVERGMAWMARDRVTVIGRRTLPPALLDLPADDAVALLERLLRFQVEGLQSESDVSSLRTLLTLTLAVAPHGSLPDRDLEILGVTAARLAILGRGQLARDLAEHTLMLAGDSPRRRRLAWSLFADVYARVGRISEAMTAAACALEIDTDLSWSQAHHEGALLVRLLRGAGLHGLARVLLMRLRSIHAHLDPDARFMSRLDTMELQLTVDELARKGRFEPAFISELLERAAAVMRCVIDSGDDPAPAASILAHVVLEAGGQGVEAPPDTIAMLAEAVGQLGHDMAARIELMGAAAPSLDGLVGLAGRTEAARYSEDVAFDQQLTVVLAQRLLASEAARDPAVAIYAIEALADSAITLPGSSRGSEPRGDRRILASHEGPLTAACELAAEGLSVVALGVAANGLTVVEISDGEPRPPVVEPAHVFARDRLVEWSRRYPYEYRDAEDPNVFVTTTRGIGLSTLPARTVVVASTMLQTFPPNLLNLADPHFGAVLAGETRRLASAPSLAWLRAARLHPFEGDSRRTAWISSAELEGANSSLKVLAERLEETLGAHGVALDTASRLPKGLAGSELVIAAAHGGLADRNRYFQGVADEAALVIGANALADALAGVRVVVLFVCSGGRLDRHPEVSAVVGLAKQLLDRGCRAVLAPPWPLETLVPPVWLPTFLAEWARGAPVIDAGFAANDAVRSRVGPEPGLAMAMTVYGDPLATRAT